MNKPDLRSSKTRPSKVSWRQLLHLPSSRPSSSKSLVSSKELGAPTQGASIEAKQPLEPATGLSPQSSSKTSTSQCSISSITSATAELLRNALQHLNDEERAIIENGVLFKSADIRLAVQGAIENAQARRRACLDKRWSFATGGKDIVLREEADKVIHWLDRFKSVGDVAANADPIHIGLPWAGIRLLLEATITDTRQMAALLIGCETALYMASRLEVYVDFWFGIPRGLTRDHLEESMTMLYTHILRFLALAMRSYETGTVRRIIHALWEVEDVLHFSDKAENLAVKIERDASNCSRIAGAKEQQLQYDVMKQVLTELEQRHQLQISLEKLQLKIDLDKIPYAEGAVFNSFDEVHTLCHPATRNALIDETQRWAKQPDEKSILWVHGPAGSGKSTISYTFCQWLATQEGSESVDLGATFFFKRGEGERGSAKRFFPTLIRQLVTKIPGLDAIIARVMESEPLIFDKTITEQFRLLVLEPWKEIEAKHDQSILVIVVDALDECEREADVGMILRSWSKLLQYTTGLRLFLTSRYEPSIHPVVRELFLGHDIFRDIDLVDAVPLSTMQHDLTIYFVDSFASIQKRYNYRHQGLVMLGEDWVSTEQIKLLVEIAGPLFIVAATICHFVGDLRFDPRERLEKILQRRSIGQLAQMEFTYSSVLDYLSEKASDDESQEELRQNFRTVIGSIIVLMDPLSMSSLATLLNSSLQSVSQQVASLQSVLRIPTDQHATIRTLHSSFAEFLLSEKAQEQPFGIHGPSAHLALSRHCLRVLSGPAGLCENICTMNDPGESRHEIEWKDITKRLSPELRYACRYWVHHIQHSHRKIQDEDEVDVFLKEHFLHWLEALSLMNQMSEAIDLLNSLRSCLSSTAPNLSAFLADAQRFVLANGHIIDRAPLQLYTSAIIFAPTDSLVRGICGKIPGWIKQYPQSPKRWHSELQNLEGHSHVVWAVAFSPDGSLIASGSYDCTVRIWNPQTGQEIQKLEGHSNVVTAVRCSASTNSYFLASASRDNTVRFWDIQTGKISRKLEGHSSWVMTIAFHAGSTLFASGSCDMTIRLWDLQTGQEVQKLEGHCGTITSIDFSSNGVLLASGSHDQTIRLWSPHIDQDSQERPEHSTWSTILVLSCNDSSLIANPFRGWDARTQQPVKFNGITSVAFSPDGSLLASGSHNNTVRIWDTRTGGEVYNLQEHSDVVTVVSFSSDGALLASGSRDRTVRFWCLQTGQEIQRLEGHFDWVTAVDFSPNESLFVSGSEDYTLRVWDLQQYERNPKLIGHSKRVNSVAFSPDGSLLATGSGDTTVRLWNPYTAQELWILKGHSDEVIKVEFSPNGSLLASASSDHTVRVWNPQTGQILQNLTGHSDWVYTIAFSTNGSLLASGSYDNTIQIWRIVQDQEVQRLEARKLEGHTNPVRVVAFSHDGFLLASGSFDNTVRIWDTQNSQEVQKFEGHSKFVNTLAFSSDSSLLASGSSDRTIRIWRMNTGQEVQKLEGHTSLVENLAFLADSSFLVSGSYDCTIRLWHLQTGQEMRKFRGNFDSVAAITSSYNGLLIAVGQQGSLSEGHYNQQEATIAKQRGFDAGDSGIINTSNAVRAESRTFTATPQWIRIGERNLLWLPQEYRGRTTFHGDRVAIGAQSGLVSIFDLDPNCI